MPTAKLVHSLIAKSIIETLLVGALAVYAFMALVPPFFNGWGEVTQSGVSGWAVNRSNPHERVVVQLYIDGVFVASQAAERSRPDVQQAGWAKDEWHGYEFSLGPVAAGRHEARVYALHGTGDGTKKSLQLLGNPILFAADGSGRISPTH